MDFHRILSFTTFRNVTRPPARTAPIGNSMKTFSAFRNQSARRVVRGTAAALAVAAVMSVSQHAQAYEVEPPVVPYDLQVPEGNVAFLKGAATGTQNYACSPAGSGFAWVLFTPEATLFNNADKQTITHFFSPNPDPRDANTDPRVVAAGAIRAAWQARDTSSVWARVFPLSQPSFDPAFVRPDSVAWLLLEKVGVQEGPRGGDLLTQTTFIHRVNTSGGLAPATGCAQSSDLGKKAFVPYTADYFFYTAAGDER